MSQPRGRSRAEKSPTAPTRRAASAKAPAEPGHAQGPAEPTAPAEPAAPTEPAASIQPTADVQAAAEPKTPAETPAEHAAPTQPAASAEPATPVDVQTTAEPAAPTDAQATDEPATPAEDATNTEPSASAEAPAGADNTDQDTPAEYAVGALIDDQTSDANAADAPLPLASHDRPSGDLSPGATSPGAASPGAARRAIMIGALVVLGIAGVGGGGTLLALHLSRATNSGATGGQAVATQWQRLPAGQIFPATIQYVSAQNVGQFAHRVGIAPTASCLDGLDPAASAAMANLGCTMVLRATYADQSGALLATVGVAVVASPHAAVTAVGRLSALRPPAGVKPEPFSGTIADLFTDVQRAATGTPVAAGRYVFFYAAGYADGRAGQSSGGNPDLDSLGRSLVTMVEHVLTGLGTR